MPEIDSAPGNTLMIVTIAPARFHHFDLARQLIKHHSLRRFYVGYPVFQLRKHGFSDARTVTFPWVATPYMALGRWGLLSRLSKRIFERLIPWTLDIFAALTMPPCDALIALSQSGLRAGIRVRKRGGVYVCDRGSTHIRFQNDILHQEFRRWGEEFPGIDSWMIEREEAEYSAADVITVPSSFVYRSFIERGVPATKLRCIPYGGDLGNFSPSGVPEAASLDVLFVGQICFRKGVPDLLDAFARVKHPNKRLRLAGGTHPEMRRFLDRQPPPPNVEFLGHVPHAELKKLMSVSHVLVLPSVEEGLALVMAQAMACGCPVIASVNSGAEDLFEDGEHGFIVPIRSPGIIAERLQRFADEPGLREKMGGAALARVRALGGWDTYGDEMIRVLTDFIDRHQ